MDLAALGRGPRPGHIADVANAEDCIHRRFERQVARDPAAVAIHFEGEDWSYEKLDRHANRLASHLQGLGVGPDEFVGIHMERGPWLLAGILGILKAGGAYVPLDPAFPAERLQVIGEDAELRVLLTECSLADRLRVPGAATVLLEPGAEFLNGAAVSAFSEVESEHLAYVIYTSGSTGKPKGVRIRHRSAVNLLCSMAAEPGFGPDDSLLAVTTISFDLSIPEIFMAFITGGRMVLAPRGVGADGEGFAEMLDRHQITFVQGTPTTWRLVLAAGWRGKRNLKIVIGGEAVDRDLAGKLMPLCDELWNFYGPTETTVWSTCLRMQPREGPVVIGRPLPGNDIYVLDEKLQPVPLGESGEICIGGDGVARGYANLPELTADKFVPDPFSSQPGALIYRTGDLGRWHADGNLECQGRVDHQVKVRGYRIELGEIESVLKEHPQVRDGVVVVHEPVPGDQRLIGYLIPDGEAPTREVLQEHLAGRLPDYMIPTAFEALESFPMTPNQKIDRKVLAQRAVVSQAPVITLAEGTPAEVIASIWRNVLNLSEVGVDDPVFKLGAHSLHVARVHAELKRRFEKRITVAQIFQHPTPRSLAEYFAGGEASSAVKRKPVANGSRDIAIVGMSARFAGARNLEDYWRNIRDGVESIRDFSKEELLAKGVSSELLADKRYVRRGCALEDHDCFDAGFFDMSPREAELTNPQHRVFLQAVWEALEHAGYVPECFEGSIGLYAGSGHNSHAHAHPGLSGPEYLQTLVGNEQDYLTTRAAFKLGLNGPALNIQTACSTSLVAIHAACQALLDGECDMAVAGGVSISWPEGQGYLYEDGLIFSPDGICRAFDAKAAGTVFGHGVSLVTLKPLDQAKADGDTIHAVIRGIAINNDGMRKGSFAAPSIEGQAEVIAAALAQQGIDPESIGLMEAHGTGTAVGDPIELAGLTQAYRKWTAKKQFCALGSVKNNIGHTDAAAGVAGLVKAVLALRHRQLPPILHYETPNPDLDLENSPFHVQTELADWTGDYPRRAAVSSFGLGGTNAHAVLEEYVADVSAGVSRPFRLLPFSARSEASFGGHAGRWIDFLKQNPDVDLSDAAFTLQRGRAAFEKRGFIVAESAADALAQMENGGLRPQSAPVMEREVVFLFTGQGAQYPGMARATYFNEPVFSRELDRCSELLEPWLGIRLIDALYPDGEGPDLNQTSLAQPALFAVSYAQARLWMSWGVKPSCMLGHSIGEYVAAVLSGVFSLEDALRLVAERGRLMQSMEPGSMLAVLRPQAEVERLLENHAVLDLAASNAPELCVVAGPAEAVSAFAKDLEGQGIASRPLHTSHAFHSRMMDGMLEEFTALVLGTARNAPQIPYVSNVTGDWISAEQAQDPAYYAEHIRRTVRFSDGVTRVLEKPKRLFLEMGPGRTLATLVGKHVEDAAATVSLATMPGAQDDTPSSRYLMEALGKAWAGGLKVDWQGLYANESRRRIPLPTYPFDEKRHRLDAPVAAKSELGKQNNLADWFYSPGWRRQPVAAAAEGKTAHVWMTLGPVPEALVKRIAARGDQLIDATSRIRPGSESDVAAFLSDCEEVPDQVLIGWTLEDVDFQAQTAQVDLGRTKTVETIEALARAWNPRKPVTVHFLTQEFHDVLGGEPAQPQWSFLLSSCLVATQEYPGIRCRQLDFDTCDEGAAEMVLAECLAPDDEPCVAWRRGRRWVRDHAQVSMEEAPPLLRQGGVYLVTGGLGRVGLLFAEHLVRKVAAKVVLVGRSGMPARSDWAARLLEIEKLGGEVLVLKADVASREALAGVITAAESKFGRIHGIIHAAGIVSSQPIGQSTPEELKRFLHSKTGGVLAVYQEAARLKLDFCLLTSSLSAVLGGLGYHAYAAGNAFLDHFARWANQHSDYPWISVNWDAWKFPDDDATAGLGSAMYRLATTPEESLRILDRVLAHQEVSRHGLVISTAPLAPRLEQWVHGPARRETTAVPDRAATTGSTIERLLGIWKHCLRREVAADDDYFDLGGYSFGGLVAYEMAQQLKAAGVETSRLLLFDTPNPQAEVRPFTLPERIMAQWRMLGDGGFAGKLAGLGKRFCSGLIFRLKFEIENRRAASATATGGGHLRHVQSRLQHDALYDAYQPVPYDGASCLFIAQDGGGDKFVYAENLGWNGVLTGDFRVIEVPGSHLEIFREPNLTHLLEAAGIQLSQEA